METYYITGVQLGMLKALAEVDIKEFNLLIDKIIDEQQTSDDVRKMVIKNGK